MLHNPGTLAPGAAAVPTEAKVRVFVPFSLVNESQEVRVATARIIQYFAEHVAVPAMTRWGLAKGFTPRVPTGDLTDRRSQPLLPILMSPSFSMYGRVPGQLDVLIQELNLGGPAPIPAVQAPAPTPAPQASSSSSSSPVSTQMTQQSKTPLFPPPRTSSSTPPPRASGSGQAGPAVSYVSPRSIRLQYVEGDEWTQEDLEAWGETLLQEKAVAPAEDPRTAKLEDALADYDQRVPAMKQRIEELEALALGQESEIETLMEQLEAVTAGE